MAKGEDGDGVGVSKLGFGFVVLEGAEVASSTWGRKGGPQEPMVG